VCPVVVPENGDKQQHHHHHHDHHNVANRLHQPYLCYHHHRIQTKIVNAVIVIIMVSIARISVGSSVSVFSARMSMHAAMARLFVLLAVCISLYTARQQIASAQPAAPAQPAASAQPVLSSMPPKRKRIVLAKRGKHSSTPPKRKRTALDMRGKHHISQRGLAHVCKDITLFGMVKSTSPRTMQRNRSALANRMTPFGTLIQEKKTRDEKRRYHEDTIPAPRGDAVGVLRREH
jgi:hypothetical protein